MKKLSAKDSDLKSRCWAKPECWIAILRSFAFLFLLFFTNVKCKKDPPPPNILPPITQEGKNTFGCKINGKVWTPYFHCSVRTGICKELRFGVYHKDTVTKVPISFELGVRRVFDDSLFTSFYMYTIETEISHTGNWIESVYVIYASGTTQFSNLKPHQKSGSFNVSKLDTIGHIMSGTFSFTLHDISGDSVVVTDGRFDLTYDACLCH